MPPRNRKVPDDGHAARLAGGHQVVENLVCDVFVENALVAELDQVVFEGPQLDAEAVGHVRDANLAEVGQPGLRTDRCELGTSDGNLVVAVRLRIGKRLERRA